MRVRPRSTHHKPGNRRTPRRPPATRNDRLPQSSRALDRQSDAGRTPRRHSDTAERWVSPKARRGHGTMHGPAPAVSPPTHKPGGTKGLPEPLTPHTTSSRRHNAGTTRAASEGGNAGSASPRKTLHCPSPAGGLPAGQEVRPPYFLPPVQKAHTHATLHTSHPHSRHGPSVTEPRFHN